MPKKTINKSPKHVAINLKIEVKPDTPYYYTTFMTVSHGPHDFTISVGKAPSFFTAEQIADAQKGEALVVESILQLIVPPRVTVSLIEALKIQVQNYEQQFGKIDIIKVNEK